MKRLWPVGALTLLLAVMGMAQETPKIVSRADALSAIMTKVQPQYPPIAKLLKIPGEVLLEAVVAEDGTVEKVIVVSGNAVLAGPSAEAVKGWRFKPFVEDGKPIRVAAPIRIEFKL